MSVRLAKRMKRLRKSGWQIVIDEELHASRASSNAIAASTAATGMSYSLATRFLFPSAMNASNRIDVLTAQSVTIGLPNAISGSSTIALLRADGYQRLAMSS